MTVKCLFCNLKNNWIYENEYFYSVFDIHPVSPGHVLVIPKKHIISFFDLDKDHWESLQEAIKETVNIINKTDLKKIYNKILIKKPSDKSSWYCERILNLNYLGKKIKGYNIGVNEGEAAGRTIHHLHIQVIPRFSGDMKDTVGGIRNIFPDLGNYIKQ